MLRLEPTEPTFYWTFENTADYESNNQLVWHSDPLGSPVITTDEIVFDYLTDEWLGYNPVRMVLEPDGFYHSHNRPEWDASTPHHHYYGLKAETASHLYIIGNWSDEAYGRGAFIAVFPFPKA